MAAFLAQVDALYLTIDLDVLPASVAPGVSAPAAYGVPLPVISAVCRQVAASGKLLHLDVAELNPEFDIDGRTAKVAARLVNTLLGNADRGGKQPCGELPPVAVLFQGPALAQPVQPVHHRGRRGAMQHDRHRHDQPRQGPQLLRLRGEVSRAQGEADVVQRADAADAEKEIVIRSRGPVLPRASASQPESGRTSRRKARATSTSAQPIPASSPRAMAPPSSTRMTTVMSRSSCST